MSNTILLKRGSNKAVSNYLGESGELVIDTDTNKLLLMDGKTAGGRSIVSDSITRLNLNKFGNLYSGKDIIFLKQLVYDTLIKNQRGYRLSALEISLDSSWINAWNIQDASYVIKDGSTWTFQTISEVNGHQNGYCQILVSLYQQQGLYTFTCLNGEMGKVYKLDCSVTQNNAIQMYRSYADGYKLVAGKINSGISNGSITFPIAFNGTNYFIATSWNYNGAINSEYGHLTINSKSTSGFTFHNETTKASIDYIVYGY